MSGPRAPAPSKPAASWVRTLGAPVDVWAVFIQARRRDPHVYAGDVHAPDAEMALLLAKENYARRDPCVSLWVVPARDIRATAEDAAEMFAPVTDKSYRFGGSYRQLQRAYRGGYHIAPTEDER
ncbi:MAG TPA: 1,2-phenylacetyl-CoA epoxidase subunit B [bacterium]|nr:1,2-phenylacetyl-CoA epoxidase subunit B [bacterium]